MIEAGRELGLNVVSGECILMFAAPTGVHKMHYWISRIARGVPEASSAP